MFGRVQHTTKTTKQTTKTTKHTTKTTKIIKVNQQAANSTKTKRKLQIYKTTINTWTEKEQTNFFQFKAPFHHCHCHHHHPILVSTYPLWRAINFSAHPKASHKLGFRQMAVFTQIELHPQCNIYGARFVLRGCRDVQSYRLLCSERTTQYVMDVNFLEAEIFLLIQQW